ncbi:mannitol 1-phosphate dehydrogenase 2 [Polyplosphaeria fusca]|uniref:Mannitol 1-phosphate dehydrogenase 2 n=1 Tax=Polyplosphaeria fusca TaxID=682080 RepID=A0A9P4R588_9PLEO|nr:mannitol 1-phosphate dehydrogenase 2 [Polyplosphaeria fusca]
MHDPSQKPFNLAIVGGGISGLILSVGLLKHNIPHTIYESAASFKEIGAGVGLAANFVRTLDLISPALREAFLNVAERPDEKNVHWFDVRVGDLRRADADGFVRKKNGQKFLIGETVIKWPGRPGLQGGVLRAHWLDEMVKLIPDHIPKFGKRLVDVLTSEDGSGDAILHFADGTIARHSAVIGCDGIKSRCREIVLGKEEAKPVFSGKYAYRGLLPMDEAVQIMGEEPPRKAQMFLGYHTHLLTFPIARGTVFNVVAFSSREVWADPQWVVQGSREEMMKDYADFHPTVKAIITAMRKPDVWALFDHQPASTFFKVDPRICLVGDAAHASTPFQGAGAGFGVEDCYILTELLATATKAGDLDKVFQTYDEVRRPRSLKLVSTSRAGGKVYQFEGEGGDDLDEIEQDMVGRMGWIWDHDIRIDLDRGLQSLNAAYPVGHSSVR